MKKIILILIFFLAAFLRLYQLDRVPAGFHSDEAALGYNAYSILLTGKDEYGRKLPLVLQSFDDYKPALYSYLAVPAIKLFGLNEFATRLPSAIFGLFSVVLFFFLTKKLTGSREIGLFSALLMAISPWHLDLSRATAESVVSLFFILLGWILFFYLHEYYIHQRVHQPWHRQYGYKQLVLSLEQLNANYQKIFVTKAEGAPYIFFLFYQRYDPVYYQSLGAPRDYDFRGFDKYIFLPQKCPSQVKDFVLNGGKLLFVDKGECEDLPYTRVLQVIYREDRSPAFRLVEVDKKDAARYFEEQEKLKI